jgi:hypothetical protein
VADSPTDNHPTINPLDSESQITISDGNLSATVATTWSNLSCTALPSTGQYYFEVTLTADTWGFGGWNIGVMAKGAISRSGSTVSATDTSYARIGVGSGSIETFSGSTQVTGYADMGKAVVGDTMCIAIDVDNEAFWFRKNNGDWYGGVDNVVGDPTTNSNGISFAGFDSPVIGANIYGCTVTFNFGQQPFKYDPPA